MTAADRSTRECHCLLCAPPDDERGHDEHFRSTAGHIKAHGWSSLAISAEDGVPGRAFTIGLWHGHGNPEVSMSGLGRSALGPEPGSTPERE